MALNTAFAGSGEFVAEREWSCPRHDYPETHECDCEHCTQGEWGCPWCAVAEWRDVLNEDGSTKMRELSVWEQGLRRLEVSMLREEMKAYETWVKMDERLKAGGKIQIVWGEDTLNGTLDGTSVSTHSEDPQNVGSKPESEPPADLQ